MYFTLIDELIKYGGFGGLGFSKPQPHFTYEFTSCLMCNNWG